MGRFDNIVDIIKSLVKYRHLRYWLFGLTLWVIWVLHYYIAYRVLHLNSVYYTILMAFVFIPYVSGMFMIFIYCKCFEKKFVWILKNHLKYWIFGLLIVAIWYLFIFVIIPISPQWWNNTHTIIFFATIPSYFSGLIVSFFIEKWMK